MDLYRDAIKVVIACLSGVLVDRIAEHAGVTSPEVVVGALIAAALLILLIVAGLHYAHTSRGVGDLKKQIDHLTETVARVSYHDAHGDCGRTLLFEECERIVAIAKTEIFVLNWWPEEREDSLPARAKYLAKLMEQSKSVPYRRIIQIKREDVVNTVFHSDYKGHFHDMLVEESPNRELHRADLTVPSTFLIVDGVHLVWELMEQRSDEHTRDRWVVRGWIEVHDHQFVGNFLSTWRDVLKHRTTDQLKKVEDLSKPSSML
jgi:hypothetical protein